MALRDSDNFVLSRSGRNLRVSAAEVKDYASGPVTTPTPGGYTVATAATSYAETATSGEKVVKVTGAGLTVSLPSAIGNAAKISFKLMVAGTLTLEPAAGQSIDGGTAAILATQYEAVTLVSDGANWQVI